MRQDDNIELDLPFALNQAERMSPLWIKISTELEKKLVVLRAKNDDETLSERETAALRGQIKSIKAFLSLGSDMSPTE